MIEIIRWILVIPSSVFGYFISMFLGMGTLLAFEKVCPAEYMLSEMCAAAYMNQVENISLIAFPSLAAMLVILLPFIVAPSKKFIVACIAYSLGALVAIYMGVETGTYSILLAVLISGGTMLYVVYRSVIMPNKALHRTSR